MHSQNVEPVAVRIRLAAVEQARALGYSEVDAVLEAAAKIEAFLAGPGLDLIQVWVVVDNDYFGTEAVVAVSVNKDEAAEIRQSKASRSMLSFQLARS